MNPEKSTPLPPPDRTMFVRLDIWDESDFSETRYTEFPLLAHWSRSHHCSFGKINVSFDLAD